MTYYEELGVPPDAPSDTIREAYRNVARLLHPDAQTNPVLKESAEVQMKRINQLYETLADPELRRRYDQELVEPPERPETIIIQTPAPEQFEHGNRGSFAWIAATAVCATFIIWLATRESAAPAVYPRSPSGQVAVPSALSRAAAAILPKTPDRQRDEEIARLRGELAAVYADRDRLAKQIGEMVAGHKFQLPPADLRQPARVPSPANFTPAPLAATVPMEISLPVPAASVPVLPPPAPVPKSEAPKMKWGGTWAYSPQRGENKGRSLLPPEFIEMVISEEYGHIRGQYKARFKVADTRVSPDVSFQFEGRVSGSTGRFSWTGNGGARGDVQLRLVSDSALEVIWSASDLGKTMGLASGTAVLNRK